MVVYGDLLFLINFSMDFLCFYFSCLLLHRRLPTARAFAASVIGGIYSVWALFISTTRGVAFAIDLLVLAVMCLIVYAAKGTTLWGYIKLVCLYFFVSALLGGVMTALFSLFNRLELFGGETDENDLNMWVFALLAALGSVFTLGGGRFFRSSASKKTATLILEGKGGRAELNALIDSGNLATEPISGKAVAFANVERCRAVLDVELYDAIKSGSSLESMPFYISSAIRFVPAKTVTGSVLVPAVRIKVARIISGNIEKDIDIYVALIDEGKIENFDAIISGEVLL